MVKLICYALMLKPAFVKKGELATASFISLCFAFTAGRSLAKYLKNLTLLQPPPHESLNLPSVIRLHFLLGSSSKTNERHQFWSR